MNKKTTLYLPDDLHRDAHVKAAQQSLTLTDVVRRLLRVWLAQQAQSPRREP